MEYMKPEIEMITFATESTMDITGNPDSESWVPMPDPEEP